MKTGLFLIIAILFVIDFSHAQWEWQSPIPQGNLLYKVQFVNASNGWAVGEYGTLFHTTDGGLHWTGQEYGRTDNILAIQMKSLSTGWAIGDNGIILHTTNGGEDWIEQVSGISTGLNSIFFSDSLTGWVAGDNEVILHTTDGGASWYFQREPSSQNSINTLIFTSATEGWAAGTNRRVFHTTDAGATWTYQMIGPSGVSHLNIFFADTLLGFIVGTGGSIMRTDNGGTTWSQISTGDTVNYNHVVMQNTLVGWIAGDGGRILRTLNGGASWSSSILSDGMDLNGISRSSNLLWMAGELGKILQSTNNGISWSSLDTGSRLSVNWIDFSSETNGVAVGQTGLILQTTNGGTSWTRKSSPTPSISMFGVKMADDTHGWAVGEDATILHTTDGTIWSSQSNPASGKFLFGVTFSDVQNGWVVGGEFLGNTGVILHTTNGGTNWNIQYTPSAVLFGICFIDNLNGWTVGSSGTILHTTNGGTDWATQTSGITTSLYWCSFVDETNGWAVGDGGTIVHTTNGGSSWTKQTSGITDNLYSLVALNATRAIIVGDGSTIIRTTNGGNSWQSEYSRTAYGIFGIAHSTQTWICGDYGSILQYIEPITVGSVTGRLVNDLNNNGSVDSGEPGMGGWKIQITGPETLSTFSSTDGVFEFSHLTLGTYTLAQTVLPSWSQTMPVSPTGYSFTLNESVTDLTQNFCNHATSTFSFALLDGWNLISLPVQVNDSHLTSVFPSASSKAYVYTTSYRGLDTLPYASGFWMKFPASSTQWVAGNPIISDTLPVRTGWNIVGSVSDSIAVSSISSEPPSLIISDYFGYKQSYAVAQFIEPGMGYWVKAAQDGIIILDGTLPSIPPTKISDQHELAQLNQIKFTDASGKSSTLFWGRDTLHAINILRYELPPAPPEGCFDVRYHDGNSLHLFPSQKDIPASFILQSVRYPLHATWIIQPSDHALYRLVNGSNQHTIVTDMLGTGSIDLENIDTENLGIAAFITPDARTIPDEFMLLQNTPNPFNPSTTIRFELPENCYVRLEVFSILGQRVGLLVDEVRPAGYHSIQWTPSTASGMYFYRLDAAPVRQPGKHLVSTKKMVLMK
jgi:photosystem II stability/assembly factor-like uncharacterized protein